MIRQQLADTLIGLVDSIGAPSETNLVVTGAEIDVPLEVVSEMAGDQLVFFASPPHSRWKSGLLPKVHTCRLQIELEETKTGETNGRG